jgi:hypothetical protein
MTLDSSSYYAQQHHQQQQQQQYQTGQFGMTAYQQALLQQQQQQYQQQQQHDDPNAAAAAAAAAMSAMSVSQNPHQLLQQQQQQQQQQQEANRLRLKVMPPFAKASSHPALLSSATTSGFRHSQAAQGVAAMASHPSAAAVAAASHASANSASSSSSSGSSAPNSASQHQQQQQQHQAGFPWPTSPSTAPSLAENTSASLLSWSSSPGNNSANAGAGHLWPGSMVSPMSPADHPLAYHPHQQNGAQGSPPLFVATSAESLAQFAAGVSGPNTPRSGRLSSANGGMNLNSSSSSSSSGGTLGGIPAGPASAGPMGPGLGMGIGVPMGMGGMGNMGMGGAGGFRRKLVSDSSLHLSLNRLRRTSQTGLRAAINPTSSPSGSSQTPGNSSMHSLQNLASASSASSSTSSLVGPHSPRGTQQSPSLNSPNASGPYMPISASASYESLAFPSSPLLDSPAPLNESADDRRSRHNLAERKRIADQTSAFKTLSAVLGPPPASASAQKGAGKIESKTSVLVRATDEVKTLRTLLRMKEIEVEGLRERLSRYEDPGPVHGMSMGMDSGSTGMT